MPFDIPIMNLAEPILFAAFLVAMRMFGVLLALPGLGSGLFSAPSQMLVVTFLTVFLMSAMGAPMVAIPDNVFIAALMMLREMALGAAMGLVINMLFAIADVAGAITAMAMSLSMAGMVDPATGEQTTAISNLLSLGGMMIFVTIGGHHEAIEGLLANLYAYPIGELSLVAFTPEVLSTLASGMVVAALQIAGPIIVVTTLINVGLGLMARAAPQVNIFAVGFSILICAGILLLDTTVLGLRDTFEAKVPTLAEQMNLHLSEVK